MEKVIVFGSLSMDMSVKCRAIPHRGETAVGSDFLTTPGGMGGNQAVMCSRMGADTFMVGKVGDDTYGRELMASLARHGVICSNVSLSADEHTGIGLVMRGEGDNRAVYDPGANATITYKEVRAAIHGLAGKDNVFLCQLGCDLEATMQSILCAKRNGLFTILNATPARSIPEEVYQALDVLC
ncbi:MAG: PfkB family carbohydrate kinase, partial [Parafannyhessea umbonata]